MKARRQRQLMGEAGAIRLCGLASSELERIWREPGNTRQMSLQKGCLLPEEKRLARPRTRRWHPAAEGMSVGICPLCVGTTSPRNLRRRRRELEPESIGSVK